MNIITKFSKYLEKKDYRNLLKNLVADGLEIKTVYDIGAHKGRWTKEHKSIFPNDDFFMFEANQEHAEKLKSRGHKTFIGVLSANGMPAKFYKKVGTGDSLYRENTGVYSEDNFEVVETKTLNKVIKEAGLTKPDFIKLDVQGAEIDVLKGASENLDSCALLLAECPVTTYNIGAPDLKEYLNYFKSIGFSPLRITEQHVSKGLLLQADILFIKDSFRIGIYGN
jgi:FkbM family methyltransferase